MDLVAEVGRISSVVHRGAWIRLSQRRVLDDP